MSPIGRVFIVLNLLLAGTFVGFAGTYLQRQDDYNKLYKAEVDARAKEKGELQAQIQRSETELNSSNISKSSLEAQLNSEKSKNERLQDENTSKDKRIAEYDADLKSLRSSYSSTATEVAAFGRQAKEALDKAIAAESTKDAAVREKDEAVAKAKDAALKIASQDETIGKKDLEIADLKQKNGELDLLVSAARVKGFIDSMAVPPLAGTIAHLAGKLCTIQISDNPTNAQIKPGFRFAVYDGTTYKGEATVENADAEKNVAFCRLDIVKGEVKIGDKANTKTD